MLSKLIKKKKHRHVQIFRYDTLVYSGRWDEVPFCKTKIIEMSITYFNDPTPCYIHQSAVRVRLIAELEESLNSEDQGTSSKKWRQQLSEYTGIHPITSLVFSEK